MDTPNQFESLPNAAKFLKSDHRLIDEHFQLSNPPVTASSIEGYFTALNHPGGQSEAIVRMHADGADRLSLVGRDGDSSTGWDYLPSPYRIRPTLTRAFYKDKALHILTTLEASPHKLSLETYANGKWVSGGADGIINLPGTDALEVRFDNNGNPWLFGSCQVRGEWISVLSYVHPRTGKWVQKPFLETTERQLHGLKLEVGQERSTLWTGLQIHLQFSIAHYQFNHENQIDVGPSERKGLGLGEVVGIQHLEIVGGSPMLDFFQLNERKLFYNYSQRPGEGQYQREEVTGGNGPHFISSVTFSELDGNCVLLALDISQHLWIRRSKGRANHRIVWEDWVGLGESFRQVAVAPKLQGEIEFFGIGGDLNLYHMYQGPDTIWYKEKISQPAPQDSKLVEARAYVTELTLEDEHGRPAVGKKVHLSATRYTEIISGNHAYHLDARSKAILETDETGKLRFSTMADDIVAPTFKVHVPELMGNAAVSIRPDIHNFEKMGDEGVNGALLLEKGIVGESYRGSADSIALAVRESAKLAIKKGDFNEEADAAALPEWKRRTPYLHGMEVFDHAAFHAYQCAPDFHHVDRAWELDLRKSEVAEFRFLEDSDMASLAENYSIVDITKGIGDWFRGVWNKLGAVLRFLVDELGNMMLQIGDVIYRIAAKTVQQVGIFMETIFKKVAAFVGDAVGKVLDWLKELLGWDHILRTQKAMEYVVTEQFKYMDSMLAWAQKFVEENFDKLDQGMRAAFDKAIADLERSIGDTSYQGLANRESGHPSMGKNPLVPDVLAKTSDGMQAQMNYASGKANDHFKAEKEEIFANAFDADLVEKVKGFFKRFMDGVVGPISEDIKELVDDLRKLQDNPADFLNKSIVIFLKLLRGLLSGILKVVKFLIVELIGLGREILGVVAKALGEEIRIPVLSELYTKVTKGSKLSLQSMFCLMGAVPTTLLYRASGIGTLVRRVEAPFKDDAELNAFLGKPLPWPSLKLEGEELQEAAKPDPIFDIVLPAAAAILEIPRGGMVIAKSFLDRKNNSELSPKPATKFGKFINGGDLLMKLLVQGFRAPFQIAHSYKPADIWAKVAWAGNFLPISGNALGCLGVSLPGKSDLGGVLSTIALLPHLVVAVNKLEAKKNVFSVLDSLITPCSGLTGFLVRDALSDHKKIAFAIGLFLNGCFLVARAGLKGGDVIWIHLNPKELQPAYSS